MYAKRFFSITHQTIKKTADILERKLLLWASFPKPSKRKQGEQYYILFLEDPETKEKFKCFIGGASVAQKLGDINELILDKPTLVELTQDSIDGGEKFNDIFFHDIDNLARLLSDKYNGQ
jgi:hypothetical protein